MTLPADPGSVPVARRFVCDCLVQLGAGAACDDAEVLVSELATNAVLHARTAFTVEVSRTDEVARVCVLDASPALPRVRDYGADATTGRGMRLIASISTAWGVETWRGGKAVWFELAVSGSATVMAWDDDVDLDTLLAAFGGEGDRDGEDDGSGGSLPAGRSA